MLHAAEKIAPNYMDFDEVSQPQLQKPVHRPRNDALSYQPLYKAAALKWYIRCSYSVALRKDAITVTPPWFRKALPLFLVSGVLAILWGAGALSVDSTWLLRGIAIASLASSLVLSWWLGRYDTISLTKNGALTVSRRFMGFGKQAGVVAEMGNIEKTQVFLRIRPPKNASNPNRNPGFGEYIPSIFELNVVGDQGERYTLMTTQKKQKALREMKKVARHFRVPLSEMF